MFNVLSLSEAPRIKDRLETLDQLDRVTGR